MSQRFNGIPVSLAAVSFVLTTLISAGAQTDPVTFHDLSAMPTWPLGNMRVKGAMGQSGSLAIAEMPPGARGRAGNPHHHAQEQIVVGLGGSPIIGIGGVSYRLGSYGAAVAPANTEHFNANGLVAGPSTFIEFQPVLRSDWFPPHKTYTAPKTPAPAAVPRNARVFEDLDPTSTEWRGEPNGSRAKALAGDTVRVTMWDLSAMTGVGELNSQAARPEQFVYVAEGAVQITVDSTRRDIRAQMLAVISTSAKDVRLRSLGKERTVIAVFESVTQPQTAMFYDLSTMPSWIVGHRD